MKFDDFLKEVALLEGLVWRKYRHHPARERVEERLSELGLQTFEAYLDFLRAHPEELSGLPDRMHITVTRFFRDARCWEQLAREIVPALVEESKQGTIRAWSAGCCGGEEPFTLAMIWLSALLPEIKILATDIDEPSLERARQACYDKGSLREVPPAILEKFFIKEKRRWCVADDVKNLVTFEHRNIFSAAPPCGMDLVLCRYIPFTYFQGSRLLGAIVRLWEALRPGGFLMIGQKEEMPPSGRDYFEPVSGCHCFYRSKG